MREQVLKMENVTMQFGGVVAVDNLNLEIGRGEIVALIGPNGAGKTTAFNVVTGVYQPTNGAVWFEGEKIIENHPQGKMKGMYKGEHGGEYTRVQAPNPDRITRMGMARTFQNIRLWKSQSVFDNVLTAIALPDDGEPVHGDVPSEPEGGGGAESACGAASGRGGPVGAAGRAGGRAAVREAAPAGDRASAGDRPKLLLLDEPAAGMNPQETDELTAFIGEIRSKFGLTVFLIEHHMDLVMDISDRIYVLDFGKQIAEGTPAEIQNDQRVIDAYLGVAENA